MKKYMTPALEVSAFDVEDIMVASGTTTTAAVNANFDTVLTDGGFKLIGSDGNETTAGGAGAAFYWN